MQHEESAFEDESDEESGNQRLEKLVIRKFEWRSEELEREFRSLDRKANRARSDRGRRMMVAREMGSFLPGSLHIFPKDAPSWALLETVHQSFLFLTFCIFFFFLWKKYFSENFYQVIRS